MASEVKGIRVDNTARNYVSKIKTGHLRMNKTQILFVGHFDKSFLKQISHDSWEIKHQPDSKHALACLENEKVDAIIAQDKIDGLNGYQLCLFIKSNPHTANLPFFILGEKKLKGKDIDGSLFAKPDRIAELSEVLKKPQSLVKLLTEELKQASKLSPSPHKQVQLMPAASCAGLDGDFLSQVTNELLLERSISNHLHKLLHRAKIKNQFITEFYIAINEILKVDLVGIGICSSPKPWLAVSSGKNLNAESFDHLLKKVKEGFFVSQEIAILSPPIAQQGGSVISDSIIVCVESSGAGLLVFAKCDNQQFSPVERAIITYIERYAAPLFELLIAQQELEQLISREAVRAAIDPLTGLYNIEFLIGFLQQQLLFSFRNKLPVSLLMIDVDRFSQINGALGQAVSDTILVKLAQRLLSVIRSSDLLARYSSDKFVVVLPNTPLKGARILAEKVRLEIEQTNFFVSAQPGPSITVSVGLAEYDPHDLNPETILKEAKTALQKAKETGRNKVAM